MRLESRGTYINSITPIENGQLVGTIGRLVEREDDEERHDYIAGNRLTNQGRVPVPHPRWLWFTVASGPCVNDNGWACSETEGKVVPAHAAVSFCDVVVAITLLRVERVKSHLSEQMNSQATTYRVTHVNGLATKKVNWNVE